GRRKTSFWRKRHQAPLSFLSLETRRLMVTFTVANNNDSGAGSLRQAIQDANGNSGLDTIAFAIGTVGSAQTISPQSTLPTIISPVTLDGFSQGGAGYTGPPLIELNGSLAGASVDGLTVTIGGSTIQGFTIDQFSRRGISLQTGGGNLIVGNYIGTDAAG